MIYTSRTPHTSWKEHMQSKQQRSQMIQVRRKQQQTKACRLNKALVFVTQYVYTKLNRLFPVYRIISENCFTNDCLFVCTVLLQIVHAGWPKAFLKICNSSIYGVTHVKMFIFFIWSKVGALNVTTFTYSLQFRETILLFICFSFKFCCSYHVVKRRCSTYAVWGKRWIYWAIISNFDFVPN